MHTDRYYEDFTPGQVFSAGPYLLTKEESVSFAAQYDPQYFHIDEALAKASPFGGLIASGWHTAAIAMRLKASTELSEVAGGLLGMGLEHLRWPQPVFPGDALRLDITLTEMRRSASRPSHGIIKYRMDVFNQREELVMEAVTAVWVPLRNPVESP